MKQLYVDHVETPLGGIWLLATGRGVCSVRFVKPRGRLLAQIPPSPRRKELVTGGPLLRRAGRQILEYLQQQRRTLPVRLDLAGFSSFERSVLKVVRRIPYGETRTYAQVAVQHGDPRSTQRVRRFLAKNPLPILVPCHRVVGARGLGYYIAGRRTKAKLIEMEQGQMGLGLGDSRR